MYVYIYTHVLYVYVCIHICVCIYIYVCVCICICIYVRVRIYIYMYVRMHVNTYIFFYFHSTPCQHTVGADGFEPSLRPGTLLCGMPHHTSTGALSSVLLHLPDVPTSAQRLFALFALRLRLFRRGLLGGELLMGHRTSLCDCLLGDFILLVLVNLLFRR